MKKVQSYSMIGDELLIAVFKNFPKGKNLNFKSDSNIMNAFYQSSKKQEYSQLFKNYHFDEDGVAPHSKEIEEGIYALHQTELFNTLSPDFSKYRLSKGIDIRFDKFISHKLNGVQKKLIQDLSEEIKTKLLEEY